MTGRVEAPTRARSAAGVAGTAGPVCGVVVVSARARGEAAAFSPQVDESRSAAQAGVLLAPGALAAARVTPLAQPRARVSIVTIGRMVRE